MVDKGHTEVCFQHRLGSLELDVQFATEAAWTVLFGPSGSGKSTVLRAMVGLLRPDAGCIKLEGEVVFDSVKKIWVPPHRRKLRWSPQRAMVDSHRTVGWNLSFGSPSRPEASADLEEAVRHFGFASLDRGADRLSGGERQRLAVIRAAIGARRRLLLLDEPFTGMDAVARAKLIESLREWTGARPVISVTHDVGEAFLLGAEVVRIAEGRVVAQGPAGEVLATERERLQEWLG